MRLNRYLASCGLGSRRKVEKLILEGKVKINGQVCQELGYKVKVGDVVEVNGKVVKPIKKIYMMVHKPLGVLSSFYDDMGRKTLTNIIPENIQRKYKLFPVGRLDMNTRGLLLLTNDGYWANIVLHPRYGVEKEYYVVLKNKIEPQDVSKLLEGVKIKVFNKEGEEVEHIVKPKRFKILENTEEGAKLTIVLTEGKKHEVRNIFKSLGKEIKYLKRFRIGKIVLDIPPGTWRFLKPSEIKSIKDYSTNQK